MEHVSKAFLGVKALRDVHFELKKGEVHALLGENGSGKSTLIKCLGGIYSMDEGEIFIENKKVKINKVHDAKKIGISIVHQELVFSPDMSVAENIYMGMEPTNSIGFVNFKRMNSLAMKALHDFGEHSIDTTQKIRTLSIARQQIVEIAKALSIGSRIIVMDEPTASLTQEEVNKLFYIIKQLCKDGISLIYISHRMEELFELSDRVTVLRDGTFIGTENTDETTPDELVKMMVGRDVEMTYTNKSVGDKLLFEVRNLSRRDNAVVNANLKLKEGEVLGIAGLVGAGRSEFARSIFGIDHKTNGQIFLDGEEISIRNPADAIRQGIALIPENRKEEGLVMLQTVGFNITLTVLNSFISGMSVNRKKEGSIIEDYFNKLKIKASSNMQKINKLSGGNQQKVVLAKWLASRPKVLILDEPTRGIDVGAKAEIYSLIKELSDSNVGIIIISSELPEILRVCNRIIVMYEGQFIGELHNEDFDEERIARIMAGVDRNGNELAQ
jgi:ABC-type sugar transport system ATPase subunit